MTLKVYKATAKTEGKIHCKIVAETIEEATEMAHTKKDWMAEAHERIVLSRDPVSNELEIELQEIVNQEDES